MKKAKIKEPTDKGEILTELIKAHMQRFDTTRKIQWTFNGLFWTGILLTAPFLLRDAKNYDPDKGNSFFVYSVLVTIAYSIVLFLFQRSLNWDKDKFKRYRNILEKMISLRKQEDRKVISWSVVWTVVQLLVTVLLLTGVYFITRK